MRRALRAALALAAICAALAGCGGSSGSTGSTPIASYAAFANPTAVTITGYTGDAMEPFISKDGQYLFFNNRNDPSIDTQIYYAARVDDRTFTLLGVVPGVNGPALDAVASLDALGNFYFVSTRSYAATFSTIFSGQWLPAGGVANVAPVQGVSLQQPGSVNFDAEISADGQTLWFDDGQYASNGVLRAASIAIANRQGPAFVRRSDSAALLAAVNVDGLNYAPSISVDGLELFFSRVDSTTSGAAPAIYRSTRPDPGSAFGPAARVAGATGFVEAPSLSADGRLLYFHKLVNGLFVVHYLQRGPSAAAPVVSNAQIVFQSQSPVPTDPGAVDELVTMNRDGSNRRQITSDGKNKFLPHFSPDGTRLVYSKFLTGAYSDPDARTDVAIYDFASASETLLTHTGTSVQPAWSADGRRIAFGTRAGDSLWIMNADGSNAHRVGAPSGALDDLRWNDFAWSSDDWILFTVAQNTGNCFKVRLDKIRPDGSARTKVTDGGPHCTPNGKEQCGDADPGFSADGKTIFTSRGFPVAPAGGPPNATERRLYAVSSSAWYAGKPETDLSLPTQPSCIEGVPKGSPDGTLVLLFRACFGAAPANGIFVTDTSGSYRTKIADGFGPDWNPAH
jgi:Tol biopolymer transport system component